MVIEIQDGTLRSLKLAEPEALVDLAVGPFPFEVMVDPIAPDLECWAEEGNSNTLHQFSPQLTPAI
jgi:hypothetical protein